MLRADPDTAVVVGCVIAVAVFLGLAVFLISLGGYAWLASIPFLCSAALLIWLPARRGWQGRHR